MQAELTGSGYKRVPARLSLHEVKFVEVVFCIANKKNTEIYFIRWNMIEPAETRTLYASIDASKLPQPIYAPKPMHKGKFSMLELQRYLVELHNEGLAPGMVGLKGQPGKQYYPSQAQHLVNYKAMFGAFASNPSPPIAALLVRTWHSCTHALTCK